MKLKIFALIIISITLIFENVSAQMFWQNSCSFAGTTASFISVPHSSTLNITASFTIEAWINPVNSTLPSSQSLIQKRAGSNNNGYTLYLSNGKVAIRTNSTTRLVGKSVIPNAQWTHICGLYDSPTGTFTIYINGAYDTSSVIAAVQPVTNSDSVLIGRGFNSPFAGMMDEIRIWNKPNEGDVAKLMNISLGTSSGQYSGLVMSMTFQDRDASGAAFTLNDFSGNNNNGINKGVTSIDESENPSGKISLNECIELDGLGDYLAGPDNPQVSPTTGITMMAWIYLRSYGGTIIHKGTSNGSNTNYSLSNNGRTAVINNNVRAGCIFCPLMPLNQWTHVAFTYSGENGIYVYYKNANVTSFNSGTSLGFVQDGTDSLYIGGSPGLTDFNGYLDEVRIIHRVLAADEIANYMFESIDESNDFPESNVSYNFDGYTVSNSDSGPRLFFRNEAAFSYNAYNNSVPVSPMNRSAALNFSKSFYLKKDNFRIPELGTYGYMIADTLNITLNETITDVNVFVALNHTNESNLTITLEAPNNETRILYSNHILKGEGDNVITIFDDQAPNALISNKYLSFGPRIIPATSINSVFAGDNTSGKWKLRISDAAAGDTGILYSWGLQFNNVTKRKSVLSLSALIQGFYNPSTDLMIPDTMKVILRGGTAPYAKLDSSKQLLNSSGATPFAFNNVSDTAIYFVELVHRNSIETWSSISQSPSSLTSESSKNFTNNISSAFGSNLIKVDSLPNKFAIYSGDVNQDGVVDGSDAALIDNDASNFATGYLVTDLNGDEVIDASDAAIADNNGFNFVGKITP